MKRIKNVTIILGVVCVLLVAGNSAFGAVSPEEAEQLKTTLTPLGAERAGNKDGTIPEWTGGLTTPLPGYEGTVRTQDPFPGEKVLFSITSDNMAQYEDKLSEGTKVMLKKYPNEFRVDVYKTHRTHAAPQWVYDNTFENATTATTNGYKLENAYGGIPFPIPKTGQEVMLNHLLRWRGASVHYEFEGWMLTSDGKKVMLNHSVNEQQMSYYIQGAEDQYNDEYWTIVTINVGPPIRAGEGLVGIQKNPDGDKTWTYLAGQRRVRRLPNPCCDTPTPFSAGISTFDEVDVGGGISSMISFDWKLVGKKEMYIPYNANKTFEPLPEELLEAHFINPDYLRWELHRVWVIEANLREGRRHTSPKNRYYLDEDTWIAVLADRWDANGQIWRMLFTTPVAAPDIPGTVNTIWGFYDLLGGTAFVNQIYGGKTAHYQIVPTFPSRVFSPQSLAGGSVR